MDWGLLNLVLGFVYLFFRIEQIEINTRNKLIRDENIARAFKVMDVNKKNYLTYDQVDELLTELYSCYVETMSPPTKDEKFEFIACQKN